MHKVRYYKAGYSGCRFIQDRPVCFVVLFLFFHDKFSNICVYLPICLSNGSDENVNYHFL